MQGNKMTAGDAKSLIGFRLYVVDAYGVGDTIYIMSARGDRIKLAHGGYMNRSLITSWRRY